MRRLFGYGSLMRGEPNHARMRGARFIAEAQTREGFALFDLGFSPAMARAREGCVTGELYEVDDAHLERLGRFEGHPDYDARAEIRLAGGRKAEAYLMGPSRVIHRERVASGDWKAHKEEKKRCGS